MNLRIRKLDIYNLVAIVDYDGDGEAICIVNKKHASMIARALTFYYRRYFHCLSSSDGNSEIHKNTIKSYLGFVQHVQCSKADFESFAERLKNMMEDNDE